MQQPKKKNPKKEMTYQRKAFEIAREHWEKQKRKAIKERDVLHGLQIVPKASFYDESHGHVPGENNIKKFGFDLHPQVSFIAGGLVLLFILSTFMFKEQSAAFFQNLLNSIGNNFGWLYILAANFFVIVMFLFAFSRFGNIKIGGPSFIWDGGSPGRRLSVCLSRASPKAELCANLFSAL